MTHTGKEVLQSAVSLTGKGPASLNAGDSEKHTER